ncbi:unnamed protein product [Mytilus edulis]|uniref:CCHC-type domain-containing protein n=1 Tax=Mytilus edulis TaxID=6550 RepID=A0A8S3TZB2_MYTED|nr:unnamed protein product [Mytilus edulis]
MDNEEDKLSLLVTGMNLRGRQVPLHSQNPRNPGNLQPDTIRIIVKNVPISADDGQIHRALTLQGCDIQSLNRKRLRVKGKITNCQTGDRIIISKLLDKPIARSLQIGKYMAIVMHSGQPEFENRGSYSDGNTKPCYKCLQVGHFVYDCPNDWVCRKCKLPGHKMMDCPNAFQVVSNKEEQIVTTDESVTVDDSQSTEQTEKLNPKKMWQTNQKVEIQKQQTLVQTMQIRQIQQNQER